MLPFRKILFPVDYSPSCGTIIPYVKEMTERFSAELALVHAYGIEAFPYTDMVLGDPDLPTEVRCGEERRLQEFAAETFPCQHADVFAEFGEAGGAVLKVVQHQGADLVMLATHGRGPLRRFLLGSVAAKVLHDISAAVWTGTGAAIADRPPRLPYQSILCALDNTDEAPAVLKAAAALASDYHAHLWLVHVIETPPATADIDFRPYYKGLVEAADFSLRELKGGLGIDAPHAVIHAPVPDGIREEAMRRDADLIVTGRGRGQAGFSKVWSQLYTIVRESPCPVLSI
jgi:nucleotide-binding universal stress UspA family protein